MPEIPEDLRYTRAHEWVRQTEDKVIVGITDYAQDQLGDVVFVGLPEPGSKVAAGEPFGEVESTKSVSDVYSPVSGTVVAKNERVEQSPDLVNSDPYGDGWLVEVEPSPEGLGDSLSAQEYRSFLEQEE